VVSELPRRASGASLPASSESYAAAPLARRLARVKTWIAATAVYPLRSIALPRKAVCATVGSVLLVTLRQVAEILH
jgi:hypothetical protein